MTEHGALWPLVEMLHQVSYTAARRLLVIIHHVKGKQHMPRKAPRAKRAKHVQAPTEPAATTLLKDQQVMLLLGISRTGLHYLMRRQGLPYIKLGEGSRTALRFNEHSLQLWLKQHEQQAVS